jgi:uncharacterized membrane protein
VFLSFVDFGNIYLLLNKGLIRILYFIEFDIIMSCCIAGPVIMMSQNRQKKKKIGKEPKDYMINLKSELEIRMLHEKLDHLIMHNKELIEIQKYKSKR